MYAMDDVLHAVDLDRRPVAPHDRAWARSRKPRYWAWDAAGLSGMTSPIDGRADVPFRHLSQGIDPCLGYSVGLGRQRPVPHAIPTKSVAAGLQSERLLGLLENPRLSPGQHEVGGRGSPMECGWTGREWPSP